MQSSWYCLIVISFPFFGTLFSPKYPASGFAVTSGEKINTWYLNTDTAEPTGLRALIFSKVMKFPGNSTGCGLEICLSLRKVKFNMFQRGDVTLINSFYRSFVQSESYEGRLRSGTSALVPLILLNPCSMGSHFRII